MFVNLVVQHRAYTKKHADERTNKSQKQLPTPPPSPQQTNKEQPLQPHQLPQTPPTKHPESQLIQNHLERVQSLISFKREATNRSNNNLLADQTPTPPLTPDEEDKANTKDFTEVSKKAAAQAPARTLVRSSTQSHIQSQSQSAQAQTRTLARSNTQSHIQSQSPSAAAPTRTLARSSTQSLLRSQSQSQSAQVQGAQVQSAQIQSAQVQGAQVPERTLVRSNTSTFYYPKRNSDMIRFNSDNKQALSPNFVSVALAGLTHRFVLVLECETRMYNDSRKGPMIAPPR
jgi:glucan-binding YG repeat protein